MLDLISLILISIVRKGSKMFAVIKTGGKQYKVQEGDILQVEKLDAEEGKEISFNRVLLIDNGKKTLIGTPFVEKALVRAVVLENLKGKKVIIFKKKRRKQYKKKSGHRQEFTEVKIEKIISGTKDLLIEKKAEEVRKEQKKTMTEQKQEVGKPGKVAEEKTEKKGTKGKAEKPLVVKTKGGRTKIEKTQKQKVHEAKEKQSKTRISDKKKEQRKKTAVSHGKVKISKEKGNGA